MGHFIGMTSLKLLILHHWHLSVEQAEVYSCWLTISFFSWLPGSISHLCNSLWSRSLDWHSDPFLLTNSCVHKASVKKALTPSLYRFQVLWFLLLLLSLVMSWPLLSSAMDYKEKPTRKIFSSVKFSLSVVSDSLRPHESQHARAPCPSPTPQIHSDSRPLSLWCHPAISSWVVPFSCPQYLPASESFPMSQLFTWGGQRLKLQL